MKTFRQWKENDSQFLNWFHQFTEKFPIGDYQHKEDRYNMMVGRIFGVLDELGEARDLFKYVSSHADCERNYPILLDRLVQKTNPEMYEEWKTEMEAARNSRQPPFQYT